MPCYIPLPATRWWRGGITIHARLAQRAPTPGHLGQDIKIPCGKCIGCKADHARNWALRCQHESTLHNQNAFLTLTYRNAENKNKKGPPTGERARSANARSQNTPVDGPKKRKEIKQEGGYSLSMIDHQKFVKRLRHISGPLRYYMCGEYGTKLERAHYHYLLFGFNFEDRYHWKKTESGSDLYRSATLEQLWPFGHAWIGDVEPESCAYVTAYCMKKITGPPAAEHYNGKMPEFARMSRGKNNAIGKAWWIKHHQDVTTQDMVVTTSGRKMRPPRYYDKQLERTDPPLWIATKHQREVKAKGLDADNTEARLMVKETVARAKMNLKKRNLEQS